MSSLLLTFQHVSALVESCCPGKLGIILYFSMLKIESDDVLHYLWMNWKLAHFLQNYQNLFATQRSTGLGKVYHLNKARCFKQLNLHLFSKKIVDIDADSGFCVRWSPSSPSASWSSPLSRSYLAPFPPFKWAILIWKYSINLTWSTYFQIWVSLNRNWL